MSLEANDRYMQIALQERHLPVSYHVAIVEGPEKSFCHQFKKLALSFQSYVRCPTATTQKDCVRANVVA